MARLLLTASICFLACQQGWATGHCDDPELDLCEDDDHSGEATGATGHCDDDELDLCEDHDHSGGGGGGGATSTSLEMHMFEGGGCSKAADPPSKHLEMNECIDLDVMTGKVTAKDATTIYLMLNAGAYPAGCTDGEGVWGSGTALDCKNDGSECCNVEMNGAVAVSYKIMPSMSSSPKPMPTPVATPTPTAAKSPKEPEVATPTPTAAKSPTATPVPTPTPSATSSSPSPTPSPAAPESADTANGQAPALMLAGTVGALLLNAA